MHLEARNRHFPTATMGGSGLAHQPREQLCVGISQDARKGMMTDVRAMGSRYAR